MIVLEDDKPRARPTDALTSHAAADGTAKKREHSWLLIESALAANQPMTAQEIIQFIRTRMGVWISESRVTTAMSELKERGAVVEVGERVNPSHYRARAWALNEEDQ